MIDWFIVLVPLAALPVVMLFVFIGCALNSEGIAWPMVALFIGKGFDTDIQSIEVTFQYNLAGGESPSNLRVSVTLQPPSLTAGTFINKTSELNLLDEPAGSLNCTCVITKKQTLEQFTVSGDQIYGGDPEESDLVAFGLFRDGDSFFELKAMTVEFEGGGLGND
jgi:hypothetical protein